MNNQLEKLIAVNVKGRVFAACQARGVVDPAIVGYYTDILDQAVRAKLDTQSTPEEFNQILEEQTSWLELEIDQIKPQADAGRGADAPTPSPVAEAELAKPQKKPSGYVPNAKSMAERLADQRAGMVQLLENDCVTLKLITPNQAKRLKLRLFGQEPEKAQEELVAELRNVLHEQVRHFIRKHDGGPWSSATLQHELRMDIVATRSLRSLVTLARDLLFEREEWLKKNKISLTKRLFGGKIGFKK